MDCVRHLDRTAIQKLAERYLGWLDELEPRAERFVDKLPDNQAFVASNEADSGTLETKEVCRLFKEAGKKEANVYVIMGELSNQAAVQRTKDIEEVIATPECSFIKII